MGNLQNGFSNVVESVYNLPLEERLELKTLLENNIADERRSEIKNNFKKAQTEHKEGKLKFSSNIKELKKML